MQGIKFKENTMLVSQTDTTGKIIYANVDFCKIAGYDFSELVGQPHSIVRHEDMPKVIFKYLWEKLQNGESIYAFVKNKAKEGGYYWVKAFISPIIKNGKVDRYVSYRILIDNEDSMRSVSNLYEVFTQYEKSHTVSDTLEYFFEYLKERNLSYVDLIVRLTEGKQVVNATALSVDVTSYFDDHVIFRTHILRQVHLKLNNITVTKPCCCRFGKWLESVKHEDYTKHREWKDVLSAHEAVHMKLQQYVDETSDGTKEEELKGLVDSIEKDTYTIFDTLKNIIDKYED